MCKLSSQGDVGLVNLVVTDFFFSEIRDWMTGGTTVAPSGMLVGTGSGATGFGNLLLGSALDPTRRGFESTSGIGFVAQLEHLVRSGDIITGSVVREIGLIAVSGGNVHFRELLPEIELFGSAEINSFLQITVS